MSRNTMRKIQNVQEIYENGVTGSQIVIDEKGPLEISDENDVGVDVFRAGKISDNNYTLVDEKGVIESIGEASLWDDLSAAIIASSLDTSSGRVIYDYFNAGVNFKSNARYPNEPVVIPLQLKHSQVYGAGVILKPHIHWLQRQAAIPNFMLGYKKVHLGQTTTFETDFSNYTFMLLDSNVFTYVSGNLCQKSRFPSIDISDLGVSSGVNMVLFRDTLNTSGLFAGVDPVVADVTVTFNDSHAKFNQFGSRTEGSK